MTQGSIVTSPDGRRWRVRRRWLERPLPSLRQLWRKHTDEAEDAWDLGLGLEAFGGLGAVVVFVVAAVIIFVMLVGIALQLIAVALALGLGLLGRVVLRRPWIVEAVELGEPEQRVAFAVEGWRDSRGAARELRTAIASAGPPERLTVGRPLATKPSFG